MTALRQVCRVPCLGGNSPISNYYIQITLLTTQLLSLELAGQEALRRVLEENSFHVRARARGRQARQTCFGSE